MLKNGKVKEVIELSDAHNSKVIFKKTLSSTLKVKNGEAVFERDSFIFDKIQYSWPLLSCLFKVDFKGTIDSANIPSRYKGFLFQLKNKYRRKS